jgi:IS30 family transposase
VKHITKEQRYQIEAYLRCKKSIEFIANSLEVHKSSIYREIKRNSTKTGKYNAAYADGLANEKKERFKRARKFDPGIERQVKKYIEQEQWSPEQITGYCKENNITMVSHERIYQYVRVNKSNGGKLYLHLRHKLKHRKRPVGGKHPPIKDRVSIDERPDVINNKERFGDWEIDTIVGKENRGAILTIAERTTGFFMMKKLPFGKDAKKLIDILTLMLLPYKEHVHSITADNGTEFAEHKQIAKKLNTKVYFTHPYSSWEKGLIEYTNKLIRQYIPKKSNFNNFNDQTIMEIQRKINRRPRKKLEFKTPTQIFFKLAS